MSTLDNAISDSYYGPQPEAVEQARRLEAALPANKKGTWVPYYDIFLWTIDGDENLTVYCPSEAAEWFIDLLESSEP